MQSYQLPKLKFKIDSNKDIQTLFAFIKDFERNNDKRILNWAILNKYPSFKKYRHNDNFKINKKEANEFVKKIYTENNTSIKNNFLLYEKNWRKKEKDFNRLIIQLFNNHSWPQGKYIAYPTIWGMFPRFLENKTFQIPHKYNNKKYVNVIIAHEMLHFIFYDYFFERHPKYKNHKYDFFIWHISEIFNAVVQNSPKWIKIFKVKSINYPEHKAIINKLSRKYYKKHYWKIDDLISDIIKMIKSSKLLKF